MDVSNGSIETTSFNNIEHLKNFILTLNPTEIVHADDKPSNTAFDFLAEDPQFKKFPVSKVKFQSVSMWVM